MKSFPFTSQDGDRKAKTADFRALFKQYFTNGVFIDPLSEFQVMEVSGMKVSVKPGHANIQGVFAYEDKDTELAIEAADSKDRIDRIVLRLNDNIANRNVSLIVVKGTAADSPQAPALTRNSSIYDLGIATVYVNASASNITQAKITDTRADTSVCGFVSGAVKQADSDTLYLQIKSDLKEFKEQEEASFSTWSEEQKTAFNEWFELIQGQLGTDPAGQLQNQINQINQTMVKIYYGTEDPSPEIIELMKNGDLYIKVSEE